MAKIDEVSRRRDTFSEGVEIVLGDGQTWTFPRPFIEVRLKFGARRARPEFDDDGNRPTYGPGYWELLDELYQASDGAERIEIVAGMAAVMLRNNYELADDELSALLPYRHGDDANVDMWSAIANVAQGHAPKAWPAI